MRALLNDDDLICENIERITAKYNLEQFTPVKVMEHKEKVLITEHGNLGNGYFLDPMQKISFKFDHLNKTVSDIQPCALDISIENWRRAVECALINYVKKHYPDGNCSVYGQTYCNNKVITACIESHKYQRNEFWNGLWKSEWKLMLCPSNAEVVGTIKVQAHYFEEGSINLTNNVDVKQNLAVKNDCEGAEAFVKIIENTDTEFQLGLMENYQRLDSLLKGLRRQLPFTHTTIDWNKIINAKIVREVDLAQALKESKSERLNFH
ncbi:F-actin-capping protein subunit alpha-2-like [Stegostoma tigrinum]|uniref:F-actin-capping protein subunit alpha-2-like n=1 Tax=Stegostoma tigrinum TaxID=3053191 RepID=UPI00202B6910|nr:F-actin-capping protein subunit alpha-2-like [Stegostoma tigrinum]XP_059505952.1 F-actin-capping protein subunit alpha-2-like [Stegostoma tigrinum]